MGSLDRLITVVDGASDTELEIARNLARTLLGGISAFSRIADAFDGRDNASGMAGMRMLDDDPHAALIIVPLVLSILSSRVGSEPRPGPDRPPEQRPAAGATSQRVGSTARGAAGRASEESVPTPLRGASEDQAARRRVQRGLRTSRHAILRVGREPERTGDNESVDNPLPLREHAQIGRCLADLDEPRREHEGVVRNSTGIREHKRRDPGQPESRLLLRDQRPEEGVEPATPSTRWFYANISCS